MTHREAKERREMMARAWRLGFKARTIAKMFRVTNGAVEMVAYRGREMFPHRYAGDDLVANRRVARG